MTGQWRPDGDDVPARMGRALTQTRKRASATRTVSLAASAVAAVLIVAIVVAVATSGGDDTQGGADPGVSPSTADESPVGGTPADGEYLVQLLGTRLCLTTGPEPVNPDRVVLVQSVCDMDDPGVKLTATGAGNRYTVALTDPDFAGKECLQVDEPADEEWRLFSAWRCADTPLQTFAFVPAGTDTYRIEVADGGLCMDSLERDDTEGMPLTTRKCDENVPTQQFQVLSA